MTYKNAAIVYREREILAASPAKLVLIVFDHLLANLRRAKVCIENKKIEARVEALGKARAAVMELLVSTDVERGGDIAKNLRALYAFMFNELLAIGRVPEPAHIERIISIASTLRDGFAGVAAEAPAAPAAPAVRTPAA